MSAREIILQRLQNSLGTTETRHAAVSDWSKSAARPVPAIAQYEGPERTKHFLSCFTAMHGTHTALSTFADLPAALTDELRNRNIDPVVRMGMEPEFSALQWPGIDVSQGPGREHELATLSRAFCASAETGTVVQLSSHHNPVTLNFLGETHFVVLKTSEIEAGFEGIWQRLRLSGKNPRTVNLITGPSRTADIEQTLELGAHGPLAVHLFLIDS